MQSTKSNILRLSAGALTATLLATSASALTLEVSITNNSAVDGLFLTPVLSIFHDGSFDTFDQGAAASAGVEAIAEGGDVSTSLADATTASTNAQVATNPAGFGGAPLIDPGETATLLFEVNSSDRYFSFLSMVIPSNDLFIGNDNPLAYEVFDTAGAFTNIGPISIFGGDVWDGGTELNDNLGAAFNSGGGVSTDTTDVISRLASLSYLLGEGRGAGGTVGSVQGAQDLLATIQIAPVPLPAGLPLLALGLGALGLAKRHKKT